MLAHTIARYCLGGVQGIQSTQRDWSPFVAHFTSWSAMENIRRIVDTDQPSRPVQDALHVVQELERADQVSFSRFTQIAADLVIRASCPRGDRNVPECVCMSECNLPSLISHAERYGRFGLVFRKSEIFDSGGRPCAYLSDEYRDLVFGAMWAASTSTEEWRRLCALCHVYRPYIAGGPLQDFAHEREWRHFGDIDLSRIAPYALLCPGDYITRVRTVLPLVERVISLDDLFEWGA